MPTGSVKWFDRKKNYGFIIMDEGDRDIFFHVKGIKDPVLKNIISPEQRVVFAILKDEKGAESTWSNELNTVIIKHKSSNKGINEIFNNILESLKCLIFKG